MRYTLPFRSSPILSLDVSTLPDTIAAGDELEITFPDVSYRAVDFALPDAGARLTLDLPMTGGLVITPRAEAPRAEIRMMLARLIPHLIDAEATIRRVTTDHAPVIA